MKRPPMTIGILIGFILISGCTSIQQTPEDLIIGKWSGTVQGQGINMTFYKNHSLYNDMGNQSLWMQYEITKDNLTFINPVNGNTTSNQYVFSGNNQKLILTERFGGILFLTRQ
jgi:hypothetical protein